MKKAAYELSFDELSQLCANRLERVFAQYLQDTPSLDLKCAMEYSLMNGGKRIRPLLIYATGSIFDAPLDNLDIPACSVELIHTYSLIHDDLPCMDNADMRRGKPSSHKEFNEGIAVLSGDALNTLAMQTLSCHSAPLSADRRVQMMKVLSTACGPYGMAAGQAFDISVMNTNSVSIELLTDIYKLKTGALFTACVELGRLASKDDDEKHQSALKDFGDHIGLAFQIQDDILDMEASSELLGKTQGIDQINNKITYPRLVGLVEAKEKVKFLYQNALEAINFMGHKAQLLRDVASAMLIRNK